MTILCIPTYIKFDIPNIPSKNKAQTAPINAKAFLCQSHMCPMPTNHQNASKKHHIHLYLLPYVEKLVHLSGLGFSTNAVKYVVNKPHGQKNPVSHPRNIKHSAAIKNGIISKVWLLKEAQNNSAKLPTI